jgi:dienelactone hydrolase
MFKKIVLVTFFFLFNMGSSIYAADDISFKGTSKSASGDALTFAGKLYKPQGNGPFPALVLMHGCNGVGQSHTSWAEKSNSWGYVTLILDSFGPRGIKNICGNTREIPENSRSLDALDAKAYLAELPFVDRNRIGIMGFSHGGGATLCAISQSNLKTFYFHYKTGLSSPDLIEPLRRVGPFKAAVAFYPFCADNLGDSESPLLILIGDKDSRAPAGHCKSNMPEGKTKHEVILKIYEGATHEFDVEGPERVVAIYKMRHDPKATADATYRVWEFLKKYLYD